MAANQRASTKHPNDRAVSVVIVALGMVFIMSMAGLGIDLASLYVARSQAQRAADAAALAGAQTFQNAGCASGISGGISSDCQTLAMQRAETIGNNNLIAGVSPGIKDADISFPSTTTTNPEIKVVAGRGVYNGSNHGNAIETFFIKIFGVTTANVSATALAEAYNPAGGSTPTGSTCVKPWLLPDCDPGNTSPQNSACSGTAAHFVLDGQVANSSAIGELMTIKPGTPGDAIGPGKFFPVFIDPGEGTSAASCPSCAQGQGSSGSQSGDQYRQNIECCNQNPIVCGQTTIQAISGNMVGPTDQGVSCLIHQGNGNSGGQDTFDPSNWQILSGGYYAPVGTALTTSDSIATIPIYDGSAICPGGSSGGSCSPANVTIIGFMQVFVKDVGAPQATVDAYIMSIIPCVVGSGGSGTGTGGTSGGGSIIGSAGSAIPIRLIHQ